MDAAIQAIPLANLATLFIPVLLAVFVLYKWSLNSGQALYALLRMVLQLVLVGYCLHYIFNADSSLIVIGVLFIMVFASSWIALGVVPSARYRLYKYALASIVVGGGLTLAIIVLGVLQLDPWYLPQFMVPLAGMVFANSMNSVSLTAERLNAEIERKVDYLKARHIAMQAALIPIINSLFAVGLVSLPGMMSGQILSGVSPLIAVRYQIMVMCMVFASSVLSTAYFLMLSKPIFLKQLETTESP